MTVAQIWWWVGGFWLAVCAAFLPFLWVVMKIEDALERRRNRRTRL